MDGSFLSHWERVLKLFLSPLHICEKMTSSFGLNSGVFSELNATENRKKQVEIFLSAMKKSGCKEVYREFCQALKATEDQKWLHELIFEDNFDPSRLEKYVEYIEAEEHRGEILNFLFPKFHNINAERFRIGMKSFIPETKYEEIGAIISEKGNISGLILLFHVLQTSEPMWLVELYKYAKEENLALSDGNGTIAEAMLVYFGKEKLERNLESEELSVTSSILTDPTPPKTYPGEVLHQGITELNKSTENKEQFEGNICSQPPIHGSEEQTCDENNGQLPLNVVDNVSESCYQQPENEVPIKNVYSATDTRQPEQVPSNSTKKRKHLDLKLRGYQRYLVDRATQQENVIVCAPPGCGKTLIAAHIIKTHLERKRGLNLPEKSRILFFAPGVALVNQQADRLKSYLPEDVEVLAIHGGTDQGTLMMSSAPVTVLTPQILANAMVKGNGIEEVCLNSFDLLIFDECHHCVKDTPYNKIMRQYIRIKNTHGDEKLPQVVGLTATLGIGKAKDLDQAVEHIMRLCASMDAVGGIAKVREEDKKELQKYIPQPFEDTIILKENRDSPLHRQLLSFMEKIVNDYLIARFDVFKIFATRKPTVGDFSQLKKGSQDFEHQCENLKRHAIHTKFQRTRDVITCIEYLKVTNRALMHYDKCQPVDCVEQLKKCVSEKQESQGEEHNETEADLLQLMQDEIGTLEGLSKEQESQNENLQIIEREIIKTFNDSPESKVMLMVEMREYVASIKKWMDSKEELKRLHPETFIGTGRGSSEINMTYKQQKNTLESFRKGRINVLICTPEAAGEGLDVVDCNCVIKYDYIRSEIGRIQTKGRVRNKSGRLLQLSTQKVEDHDKLNIFKERLMEDATGDVESQKDKQDNTDSYTTKLKELQADDAKECEKRALKKSERYKKIDRELDLSCRKCSVFVCKSYDVRRGNNGQYICVSKEFQKKFKSQEHPRGNDNKSWHKAWQRKSKICCSKCGCDWGIQAEWKGSRIFALMKIKGFKITDPSQSEFTQLPKKWKDACFNPQKIELDEVAESEEPDDAAEVPMPDSRAESREVDVIVQVQEPDEIVSAEEPDVIVQVQEPGEIVSAEEPDVIAGMVEHDEMVNVGEANVIAGVEE